MNQLSAEKRAALKRLLAAGASYRAIATTLRIANPTVCRYARMWQFSSICGCGKPTGHRGWCRVRLDYSPVRRGWLAKAWHTRANSQLTRTVDAATAAAQALGHDLGRFVWASQGASSMAFATCRICGKQVRIFSGESQWERAAEEAARQEQRQWREGKRTLRALKRVLRDPSHSPSAAFTPAPNSRR